MTDFIDIYCERTAPGFWDEPLNGLTNAAFLVAALAAFILARREKAPAVEMAQLFDAGKPGRGKTGNPGKPGQFIFFPLSRRRAPPSLSLAFIALTFIALSFALLPAAPALADKGGKGREYTGRPAKHADKPADNAAKAEQDVLGFNEEEADIITGVLRGLYGEEAEIVRPSREFCPPGLAKKNNGCMPPGLAKKYKVGETLSEDVMTSAISDALREVLGLPPRGRKYVQVDNDVLLIEEGTRLVLDAIGLRQ